MKAMWIRYQQGALLARLRMVSVCVEAGCQGHRGRSNIHVSLEDLRKEFSSIAASRDSKNTVHCVHLRRLLTAS
jgi:hypothetical protein